MSSLRWWIHSMASWPSHWMAPIQPMIVWDVIHSNTSLEQSVTNDGPIHWRNRMASCPKCSIKWLKSFKRSYSLTCWLSLIAADTRLIVNAIDTTIANQAKCKSIVLLIHANVKHIKNLHFILNDRVFWGIVREKTVG